MEAFDRRPLRQSLQRIRQPSVTLSLHFDGIQASWDLFAPEGVE
jgi:hypothetical protein